MSKNIEMKPMTIINIFNYFKIPLKDYLILEPISLLCMNCSYLSCIQYFSFGQVPNSIIVLQDWLYSSEKFAMPSFSKHKTLLMDLWSFKWFQLKKHLRPVKNCNSLLMFAPNSRMPTLNTRQKQMVNGNLPPMLYLLDWIVSSKDVMISCISPIQSYNSINFLKLTSEVPKVKH